MDPGNKRDDTHTCTQADLKLLLKYQEEPTLLFSINVLIIGCGSTGAGIWLRQVPCLSSGDTDAQKHTAISHTERNYAHRDGRGNTGYIPIPKSKRPPPASGHIKIKVTDLVASMKEAKTSFRQHAAAFSLLDSSFQ